MDSAMTDALQMNELAAEIADRIEATPHVLRVRVQTLATARA